MGQGRPVLWGSLEGLYFDAIQTTIPKGGIMSEQNKELTRRFYEEVMNRKNLQAIDELCAPEIVDHTAMPGQAPGLEGMKQMFAMFVEAFPDMRIEVEDLIAERDLVVARLAMSGTHKGPLFGTPPTGKHVTFRGVDMVRIRDGRATEVWHYGDDFLVLGQLGVKLPG